jgi:hypothetical protein
VRPAGALRGCSSMAEPQPSKLAMPVRSRSPALPRQSRFPRLRTWLRNPALPLTLLPAARPRAASRLTARTADASSPEVISMSNQETAAPSIGLGVTAIRFTDHEPEETPPSGVLIVVGPNNVGKSQFCANSVMDCFGMTLYRDAGSTPSACNSRDRSTISPSGYRGSRIRVESGTHTRASA